MKISSFKRILRLQYNMFLAIQKIQQYNMFIRVSWCTLAPMCYKCRSQCELPPALLESLMPLSGVFPPLMVALSIPLAGLKLA